MLTKNSWVLLVLVLSVLYSMQSISADVAAKLNGKSITYQQLNEGIKTPLYDAQMKVYDLQYSQLQNILLQELVKVHPVGKNMSFQDFMAKHVVKNTSVTEQMVDQFIKVNRVPANKITADYRGQVTKYLRSELIRNQVTNWFDEEAKKHDLVFNLKKPERPRTQIPIGKSPTLGSDDAKITIVEYSDFQCPYCARAEKTVQEVLKKFGKDVRLVYKQYPLSF
ncbi:MAG: DsbA family protein, partial [Kangiellaceae bacterium]